jgi:hypothetical protein
MRQPTLCDRPIEAGYVFGRRALVLAEKRPVDQFDVDATVLHRLDRIGDLDQLAGGLFRIRVGSGRSPARPRGAVVWRGRANVACGVARASGALRPTSPLQAV